MKIPEQLGALLFRSKKSSIRFACWTALVLIPALILVFPSRQSITVNEIIGGAVLGGITLYLLLDYMWARVDMYENGIVHRRLFSRRKIILFNEFTQIYVRRWCLGFLHWRFLHHTTVFIENDGYQDKISSNFHRNNEIIAATEAYIYKNSMHMLNQLFDAGEILSFGAVQLGRNQIVIGNKNLQIQSIGSVNIKDGYMRLYEKNGRGGIKRLAFSKIKLRYIANLNMLARFIELNDVNVEKFSYRVFRIPFL